MAQFEHEGVLYEELPGGKVRVIGPSRATGPVQISGPDPFKVAGERREQIEFEERNAPKLPEGFRWKNGAVGGQAEPIPGLPAKKGLIGRSMSPQEQTLLNDIRRQSESGSSTLQQYLKAAGAIERSDITPDRSAVIESAIPKEGAGSLGSLGPKLNRYMFGVTPQEIDDFQYLQSLQSAQVLDRQQEQKGPQTESDAARLALTEIGPFKTQGANASIIGDGVLRARLGSRKAPFFVEWANKYGLNGLDPQGRSVDEAWNGIVEEAQGNLSMQRNRRRMGMPGLSADQLKAYRKLAESGGTPEQLQTFVLNATGGQGQLANAGEVAAARDAGRGVNTRPEYQGFSIKRIK